MVQLLELPTEILEMVFERIGCPPSPAIRCYSYAPEDDRGKRRILHDFLKLRLVHSRFRSLIDPVIFSSIECLVDFSSRTPGPTRLLALEHIAKYVKKVRLAIAKQSIAVEGIMAMGINELLQNCANVLENLEICAQGSSIEPYFYTGFFSLSLPKLRTLSIVHEAFLLCLPSVFKLAPRLDNVTLGINVDWGFQDLEKDHYLDYISALWEEDRRPNRSLESLTLRNLTPWLQCLFARFKLPTKRFTVQSKHQIPRCGSRRISSNAFLYLGEIEDFSAFSLSCPPVKVIRGLEEDGKELRKHWLLRDLEDAWKGKGIVFEMVQPEAKASTEALMLSEDSSSESDDSSDEGSLESLAEE
jgi:hypothetical protein